MTTETASSSIRFSVSYALPEYLSIVEEHLPTALAEQARRSGRAPKELSRLHRVLLVPFASLAFAFKKWRMPVCDFTISPEGIWRATALGTLHVPWKEVTAVHRYSKGYLLAKREGAMPLPYRCFTPESAELFDRLVQEWRKDR